MSVWKVTCAYVTSRGRRFWQLPGFLQLCRTKSPSRKDYMFFFGSINPFQLQVCFSICWHGYIDAWGPDLLLWTFFGFSLWLLPRARSATVLDGLTGCILRKIIAPRIENGLVIPHAIWWGKAPTSASSGRSCRNTVHIKLNTPAQFDQTIEQIKG